MLFIPFAAAASCFNGLFNAVYDEQNCFLLLKSLAKANGIMTHSTIKMIMFCWLHKDFVFVLFWCALMHSASFETLSDATKSPTAVSAGAPFHAKRSPKVDSHHRRSQSNWLFISITESRIDDLNKIRIRCFLATCVFLLTLFQFLFHTQLSRWLSPREINL